jgi:3-phenylpropionate/trans-cinnamate dioxygenase ferredoxin component
VTGDGLHWVEIPIPLPAVGENATFVVGELALLLCNAAGTPFIVRDECPHVKTSLQGGLIKGTILECPLHGGLLDLRDGRPVAMPIRRPVTCYPVRSAGEGWQVGLPATGSNE